MDGLRRIAGMARSHRRRTITRGEPSRTLNVNPESESESSSSIMMVAGAALRAGAARFVGALREPLRPLAVDRCVAVSSSSSSISMSSPRTVFELPMASESLSSESGTAGFALLFAFGLALDVDALEVDALALLPVLDGELSFSWPFEVVMASYKSSSSSSSSARCTCENAVPLRSL